MKRKTCKSCHRNIIEKNGYLESGIHRGPYWHKGCYVRIHPESRIIVFSTAEGKGKV